MVVTIKDVAREAGVDHTTVSRALRDSPLISLETTERVRLVAARMGYEASAAARSLKTNRSGVLGVIVSSIDDPFFSEILQGIDDVAQESGYSLFIAAARHDPKHERLIVRTMREHRVDGVILCSTPFSAEQSKQLHSYNIPIVVINNQSAEDYRYSIYHDDIDGSRRLVRHLIELGHRRIAYLGNATSGRSTQDRLSGFRQELTAARIYLPDGYVHQVAGGRPEDGLAGLSYFLSLPERPTALVCYNDMMAIGVLKGLQQAGIRVPEQMSITGFDNIVFSAFTNPPITTFDQPKRFIGAEAAGLVLGLLSAGVDEVAPGPKIQTLKGKLLVRESTAPPAK